MDGSEENLDDLVILDETAEMDQREQEIQEQRAAARVSQQKQADKMLEASNQRFFKFYKF